MNHTSLKYLEFDRLPGLSHFDKAFQNRDEKLLPFVGQWADMESFSKMFSQKQIPNERRSTLVQAIRSQLESIGLWGKYSENVLSLLDKQTFVVTTAHQPVLFGGPLYIPYKIASTINLAKKLSRRYDAYKVIPVFVIGGEDHDFDEMNHLNLYGKEVKWSDTPGGAVGRMNTESLLSVIEEVNNILGDRTNFDVATLLRDSFIGKKSYAEGYQAFIMTLFGHYGLIALNLDDESLKSSFRDNMMKEVFDMPSKSLVEAEQDKIEAAGFKKQAFAREINLFYLADGVRSVILKEPTGYYLRELDEHWDAEKMRSELKYHPDRFSPNVILRPIYQEFILPNLAYIGGGGELAYWSERKTQFESYGIQRPLLIRRQSVVYFEDHVLKRMGKVGLTLDDMWMDMHVVLRELLGSENEIIEKLQRMSKETLSSFQQMVDIMSKESNSLGQYATAEKRKLEKTLDSFQTKTVRMLKKEDETKVAQIEKIYNLLFPNGGLQERHDNFLALLSRHGSSFLDLLVENLDPLNRKVTLILEK